MKLGGHETFYPRPGWLTKGLLHLHEGHSGTFSTPEIADELGVGRNMAKSIGWWLHTTGLAERPNKSGPLALSELGQIVAERDPFLALLGTWWLIHGAALTANTGSSLPWFFSHRRLERFDRTMLVDSLSQDLTIQNGKPPPLRSVQREVATLLQAYAVPVPRPQRDPEDNLGSPLHRLNLFRHVRAIDRFERSDPTPVPPETLGLVLSACAISASTQTLDEDILLDIPASSPAMVSASAILGSTREDLLEIASTGTKDVGGARMAIRFLASERVVSIRSARAATWARLFYDRMGLAARKCAA